ncbi:MAG: hypothetical protein RLN76_06280 [Phycisphaeraceae bacterium]
MTPNSIPETPTVLRITRWEEDQEKATTKQTVNRLAWTPLHTTWLTDLKLRRLLRERGPGVLATYVAGLVQAATSPHRGLIEDASGQALEPAELAEVLNAQDAEQVAGDVEALISIGWIERVDADQARRKADARKAQRQQQRSQRDGRTPTEPAPSEAGSHERHRPVTDASMTRLNVEGGASKTGHRDVFAQTDRQTDKQTNTPPPTPPLSRGGAEPRGGGGGLKKPEGPAEELLLRAGVAPAKARKLADAGVTDVQVLEAYAEIDPEAVDSVPAVLAARLNQDPNPRGKPDPFKVAKALRLLAPPGTAVRIDNQLIPVPERPKGNPFGIYLTAGSDPDIPADRIRDIRLDIQPQDVA